MAHTIILFTGTWHWLYEIHSHKDCTRIYKRQRQQRDLLSAFQSGQKVFSSTISFCESEDFQYLATGC